MKAVNNCTTVSLPVAAVQFINHAKVLLGEAVTIYLASSDNNGPETLEVIWRESVPEHIKDRVEAAAEEISEALEENCPLLLASEASGSLKLLLNI